MGKIRRFPAISNVALADSANLANGKAALMSFPGALLGTVYLYADAMGW